MHATAALCKGVACWCCHAPPLLRSAPSIPCFQQRHSRHSLAAALPRCPPCASCAPTALRAGGVPVEQPRVPPLLQAELVDFSKAHGLGLDASCAATLHKTLRALIQARRAAALPTAQCGRCALALCTELCTALFTALCTAHFKKGSDCTIEAGSSGSEPPRGSGSLQDVISAACEAGSRPASSRRSGRRWRRWRF